MTLEVLTYIAYIQTALSASVAVIAFIKFKVRPIYIKLIGLAFLIGFVTNVVGLIFLKAHLKTNINIMYSIYDLTIILIISLIFYYALNMRYGRYFLIVNICFWIFAIINLLWFQKQSISSYNKFLSSFIIINYCVFYFYRLMVELPSTHLQRMPMFWFNSGFLIYYAGALILFIFTSYIINVLKDNLLSYWIFHNLLNIFEHLIVLVGLYFDLRTKPLASSVEL